MNAQIAFFLVMVTVFVSYVSWIWSKYGVLPSISDSYYHLPDKLKFVMTLFCSGFAFPAAVLGSSYLMTLAAGGIIFVGAAAAFKQKMTATFHIAGAVIGVIASQLAIFFDYGMWGINIAFLTIALPLFVTRFIKKKDGSEICKNRTWWIEIAAFLAICVVLAMNLALNNAASFMIK